ncbi:putative ABC transporter transmembrane region 2 ABC transporter [Trypanosoma vivax]|uniref:Putative ABC transporter n=1 Tax=Trypanosoma vivax (strain Y486) TaxID=1055687 RepID=G0U9Y0_TRYVY|nr:putative ABC transporter [Trypanosoma vivax]KAH8619142.1 putative ABC transporter transmembrane region 2 ABC transporter [Trypanosoma vivax]CCC52611.1 putative ABC transporter [Trypanosoma vivax Y486]
MMVLGTALFSPRECGVIVGGTLLFSLCAAVQRLALSRCNVLDGHQAEEHASSASLLRDFMRIGALALPTARCKEFFGTLLFVSLFPIMSLFRTFLSDTDGRLLEAMTNGPAIQRASCFVRMLLVRTTLFLMYSACRSLAEFLRMWLIGCYRVRLSRHFQQRLYDRHVFYKAIALNKRLEAADSAIASYCGEFAEHFAELPYYFLLPALECVTSLVALSRKIGRGAALGACVSTIASFVLVKRISPPFGAVHASLLSKEDDYRRMLTSSMEHVENISMQGGATYTHHKLEGRLNTLRSALFRYALSCGHFELLEQTFSVMMRSIASIVVFRGSFLRREKALSDIYVELLHIKDLSRSLKSIMVNLREFSHLSIYTTKLAEFDATLNAIALEAWEDDTVKDGGFAVNGIASGIVESVVASDCSAVHTGVPLFTCSGLKLTTPEGRVLLENLDLSISIGQSWAIVGSNGIGKTSFLRLLCGLWHPSEGRLAVDRRVKIFPASQESYMVPCCTLLEQLSFPQPAKEITEKHITLLSEAVRLAGAQSVVDVLGGFCSPFVGLDVSNKDDTYDWSSLSGGQKQRINMARVFYHLLQIDRAHHLPVVLLDEATSMMDETMDEILLNLRRLNVCLISVTHREEVVRHHTHLLTILKGGKWEVSGVSAHKMLEGTTTLSA